MKQVARKVQLRSPAFSHEERIPKRHAHPPEGMDISPPLSWSLVPQSAKELVIICDDPDAPQAEPFVHWVAYKIPTRAQGMPEGAGKGGATGRLAGMLQGKNSFGQVGYGGPLPPVGHGTHSYRFRLYAIDTQLELGEGASKEQVLEAIEGHVVGEGELVGTYERFSTGRDTSAAPDDGPELGEAGA